RVGVTDVGQRTHKFIPEPYLNRRTARDRETILSETVGIPLPQLHLRNAGLALLHCRQTQQKTGESRTRVVVGRGLSRKAVRELVVASILKEAPHRPYIVPVTAAKLQAVTADLPAQLIPPFYYRVPGMHRRGSIGIAHPRVALDIEPWRAKRSLSPETHTLDAKFRHDIVGVARFGGPVHRETRHGHCCGIHHCGAQNAGPGDTSMLRQIVVQSTEAWQILGHET